MDEVGCSRGSTNSSTKCKADACRGSTVESQGHQGNGVKRTKQPEKRPSGYPVENHENDEPHDENHGHGNEYAPCADGIVGDVPLHGVLLEHGGYAASLMKWMDRRRVAESGPGTRQPPPRHLARFRAANLSWLRCIIGRWSGNRQLAPRTVAQKPGRSRHRLQRIVAGSGRCCVVKRWSRRLQWPSWRGEARRRLAWPSRLPVAQGEICRAVGLRGHGEECVAAAAAARDQSWAENCQPANWNTWNSFGRTSFNASMKLLIRWPAGHSLAPEQEKSDTTSALTTLISALVPWMATLQPAGKSFEAAARRTRECAFCLPSCSCVVCGSFSISRRSTINIPASSRRTKNWLLPSPPPVARMTSSPTARQQNDHQQGQ